MFQQHRDHERRERGDRDEDRQEHPDADLVLGRHGGRLAVAKLTCRLSRAAVFSSLHHRLDGGRLVGRAIEQGGEGTYARVVDGRLLVLGRVLATRRRAPAWRKAATESRPAWRCWSAAARRAPWDVDAKAVSGIGSRTSARGATPRPGPARIDAPLSEQRRAGSCASCAARATSAIGSGIDGSTARGDGGSAARPGDWWSRCLGFLHGMAPESIS